MHGICESRESWTPIISQLVDEYRCIRVDLRGHGESARIPRYDPAGYLADVEAVIAATCTAPPIVIGHSLGGAIATAACALALGGPTICVDSLKLGALAEEIAGLAPRLRNPATFADALMEEKLTLGLGQVPEPMFSSLERVTRSSEPTVILDSWQPMIDGDVDAVAAMDAALEALLPSITQPYLALHGREPGDEYEQWFTKTIPSGDLEVWEGCGHWLHLVEIDRFVERVRRFVAELD